MERLGVIVKRRLEERTSFSLYGVIFRTISGTHVEREILMNLLV